MRARWCLSLIVTVWGFALSPAVSALTMDWTPVGNPINTCDLQSQGCFGSVGYAYNVGTYEVTNSQYAEFLNAKAASDPLGLYNTDMGASIHGGITRTGSAGAYGYSAIAGREDMPVNFVSFYDALRFANWLNNGQGGGDTETGTYTLLGGTPTPSNGLVVTRTAGSSIFLTSEDEWYKSAYYNSIATSYFDYPAGSDTQTTCSTPTAAPNHANCSALYPNLTTRGSYTGSASPYGTFDQGGNVIEWNEAIIGTFGVYRGLRGGWMNGGGFSLAVSDRGFGVPTVELNHLGFRVAMIPEPGTGLLVTLGLLGLARRRRRDLQAPPPGTVGGAEVR